MAAHHPLARTLIGALLAATLLAGCTSTPPPPGDPDGAGGASPATHSPPRPAPPATGEPTSEPAGDPRGDPGEDTGEDTGGDPAEDPASALPELPPVTAPEWSPATRTEELAVALAEWTPDAGEHVPTQLAVDIFSVSVAPLPGSTRSDLPDGDGLGATAAIGLIESVRERLSAEQRDLVDRAIPSGGNIVAHARVLADGTVTVPLAAGPGKALRAAPAPSPDQARYVTLLSATLSDWRAYRPDVPGYSQIGILFADKQIKDYGMTALPHADNRRECVITVYPGLYGDTVTDDVIKVYFAHELFHCAQFAWAGNQNRAMPAWLQEGSADFAAFDLYRSTLAPPGKGLRLDWFSAPGTTLAARAYGAWPLFESARQYGLRPYEAIKAMVAASPAGTTATLAAGGLTAAGFEAFVSSQSLRSTSRPQDTWLMQWPGPAPAAGPRDTGITGPARGLGSYPVTAGAGSPYSHPQLLVPMTSDVGLVDVRAADGPMQTISAIGTVVVPEGRREIFCVDPGGCQCPEGTSPTIEAIPLTPPMVFSFPQRGRPTTANARNLAWDPAKYCGKPKPRNRSAASNGDPHLVTFDGYAYDVMALGEFVLTEDPGEGLLVQTRHELVGRASATSAVAIGTGAHRITATTRLEPDGPVTVRLDGSAIRESSFAAGDVTIRVDGQVLTATWPDGSTVVADAVYGFFVTVTLAPERAARTVGLLGAFDRNPYNDLLLPDGTAPASADPDAAFAPAWAVDERTTLFDYGPGESPASFRKPLPPVEVDIADETVRQCSDRLGEHATSHEIDSCALDVAVTGSTVFLDAYQAVTEQRVSANGAAVAAGPPAAPPAGTAGAPAATGRPALTLSGTLGAGDFTGLTGSMRLAGGTVVVARMDTCRPGVDIEVALTARDGGARAGKSLCEQAPLTSISPDDQVNLREGYLWVPTGGTYDVRVTAHSDEPVAVAMDLFADPTPTLITAEQFAADGFTGTLAGIADTVVITAAAPERTLQWSMSFDAGVCAGQEWGAEFGSAAPWPIATSNVGVCHRQRELSVGSADPRVPLIVYSRADGPQQVSITPR